MEKQKCKATSRTGRSCGNHAIPGGTVCRMHGGAAPQVKEAARKRLLALVNPALLQLEVLITARSEMVSLLAVKDILDRAGLIAEPLSAKPPGEDIGPLVIVAKE